MRHGSLFSGIGGFDLAAQWMGWENVFHCEWNEFGQKVLKYHFPKAISYNDITKTDFSVHRGHIDIITGGFPCQPFSAAGKRKGTEDDRYLWHEMLRAVQEIQPKYIVAENVRGLTNWNGGMVFDQVQADMENEGFEVLPFLLPACAVNAPHRRDRIWFVGHKKEFNGNTEGKRNTEIGKVFRERKRYNESTNTFGICENNATNSDTGRRRQNSIQSELRTKEFEQLQGDTWRAGQTEDGKGQEGTGREQTTSDTKRGSSKGQYKQRQKQREFRRCNSEIIPNWNDFPTQSPVCSRDDGVSYGLDGITFSKWRNESIKAYGNAIVPQVCLEIFKAIEQCENLMQNEQDKRVQ